MQDLKDQVIHLWRDTLDRAPSEVSRFETMLSADERAVADRFKFAVHRARFVSGRALLRCILARYLGVMPSAIEFGYSEFGKPHLRSRRDLHFNVAHSEDRFIAAVGLRPVGVDVEVRGRFNLAAELEALGEQVFSEPELQRWKVIAENDKPEAFLGLWTRKEALLKGIGLGIAHHLKTVSVFFSQGADVLMPERLCRERWQLKTVFEPDVVYSVAAAGRSIEVIERR